MNNLQPLPNPAFSIFRLLASKKVTYTSIIQPIETEVHALYNWYDSNCPSLASLSAYHFMAHERSALLSCYGDGSINFNQLYKDIFDMQVLHTLCQYCGINQANTLDHYVAKTVFPEYAIHPWNLVPCCNTCNLKKGTIFMINGVRQFIHFYFDRLPSIQMLVATITFPAAPRLPQFQFTLTAAYTPEEHLYARHFHRLELASRYRKSAAGELSLARSMARIKNYRLTFNELKIKFEEKEEQILRAYNYNHWQVAFYRAASLSNDFIDFCIATCP